MAFDNTGDEIPFDPVNQVVLDFYIDRLNQLNLNSFFSKYQQGTAIQYNIDGLKSNILEVNKWLYDLADVTFDVCDDEKYLDQRVLNKLHADWANLQHQVYDIQKKRKQFNFSGPAEQIHDMFPDDIQTPPLAVVIDKLGLSPIYNSINAPYVHKLEEMFNIVRYTVSDTWTKLSDNPFPKTVLTNDRANISISFNHLGRTLYNKFINFDRDLEFADENSYNELLGFVTLSLLPSQTIPLSIEYVNWCKHHNKEPSGDFLNIGNIPNLYENLTKYRIIIFRNLLANNRFSIQHTKG